MVEHICAGVDSRAVFAIGDKVRAHIDKLGSYAFMYGGAVTGRMGDDEWGRNNLINSDNRERGMKLSKQNFDRLAAMTREIDAGIATAVSLPPETHEQVMNVVRARLALVCAEGNASFDSFRFDAACKGVKE